MSHVCLWVPAVFATLALVHPDTAHARPGGSAQASASAARCVSLPLPSLRGADGNASDLAAALRDLVSSFLTGPSFRTVLLDARLAEHAIAEAQEKNCGAVLTVTLTKKKSGGGALGRVLGSAASEAAWRLPYGNSAGTTAARSAAIAGTSAASHLASSTRAKDEMLLEFRLSSGGSTVLREGKDTAKAKTDGEDLVTPLVERMAAVVAGAVTK